MQNIGIDKKELEKFSKKENVQIVPLQVKDGYKISMGKGKQFEWVDRISLYVHQGDHGVQKKQIVSMQKEMPWRIVFHEKGRIVIDTGNETIYGGFKGCMSKILVLIEAESVNVLLIYDSEYMRRASVLVSEISEQRNSLLQLFIKLTEMKFCEGQPQLCRIEAKEQEATENAAEKKGGISYE